MAERLPINRLYVPQIILVAGMGSRVSSSVMLPMLQEQCKLRGLPVHCVEGVTTKDSRQEIASPSQQLEAIEEIINETPEWQCVILISHCIGAIAAMRALEDHRTLTPSKNQKVKGIFIAPPFKSPLETVAHPNVQEKIVEKNGRAHMRVGDFSPDEPYNYEKLRYTDVALGPGFMEELVAVSKGIEFVQRADALAKEGRLSLVVPQKDWNTDGVLVATEWNENIEVLEGARHSLNAPDRSLRGQCDNCQQVIDFALMS